MVDDIQNDMDALRNELLTRVSEVKVLASGTKDSLERTQTEMVRVLNKKAYKSEVQKMLQDKVDRSELEAFAKDAVVQQMLRAKVRFKEVAPRSLGFSALLTTLSSR